MTIKFLLIISLFLISTFEINISLSDDQISTSSTIASLSKVKNEIDSLLDTSSIKNSLKTIINGKIIFYIIFPININLFLIVY